MINPVWRLPSWLSALHAFFWIYTINATNVPQCRAGESTLLALGRGFGSIVFGNELPPAKRASIEALVRCVTSDPDDLLARRESQEYCDVVIQFGVAEHAVARLVGLAARDDSLDLRTLRAFHRLGPGAISGAPYARRQLRNSIYPNVRDEAAYALQQIGAAAAETLDALESGLRDEKQYVAIACANALCSLQPTSEADSARLIEIVSRVPFTQSHIDAISVLARVSNPGANVVEYIASRLKDSSARVRIAAAENLLRVGELRDEATAVLVSVASIEGGVVDDAANDTVRIEAAQALAKNGIQRELVQRVLTRALNAAYPSTRERSVRALSEVLDDDAKNVPTFVKALSDQDARVRAAGVDALRKKCDNSPNVVAALAKARQDPKDYVRWKASIALNSITGGDNHDD
jgi:HEAT repeat protein